MVVFRLSRLLVGPRQQPGRRLKLAAIVAWLLAWAPSPVLTQAVPDEPACGECTIRVDTVVEFGNDLDDGLLSSALARVYSLREGRFGVSDSDSRGFVKLYAPNGTYVGMVGARGQGPGEYEGISDIFRTDDGYLVFDVSLGRLSWVDEEFQYQRSTQLEFSAMRLALLPGGDRLLANALAGDGLSSGHVLAVATIGETPEQSFGGSGRPLDLRRNQLQHHRVFSYPSAGAFWASELTHYRPTKYSLSGEVLASIDRSDKLFPGSDSPRTPRSPTDPPPTPAMRALFSDADGLLWAVYQVADSDWGAAVRDRASTEVPGRNSLYDSVVEVLDPVSATVLARTTVPWAMTRVSMMEASGQLLMSYVSEKANGLLGGTVLRFTLERSAAKGSGQ